MTTNGHTTPKRDKHTARSARILTTGISIASVLGLTSAYALAAQQNPPTSVNEPIAPTLGVAQSVAPLASASAIAPTQPAPATPVPALVAAVAPTQPAAAPVVTPQIMVLVPMPTPVATRSSGSK